MIHHVFANRSNIGDWLSARAIQSLLGPREIREHLCDQPFVAQTLSEVANANSDHFILIGGGGLFMDYFEPFWQGFREVAERVSYGIWGVGYCDMKREKSRPGQKLIEEIASRARFCIVRDELTRGYLASSNLPAPVVCPTVNLVDRREVGNGVLHVDAYDNVGPEIYAEMNSIGRRFATQTGRSFRAINNLIESGSEKALARALDHYAEADIVLSGRLHGCIIGLSMGRKVVAVSGDHKVESFMSAAGLGDWVLDLNQIGELPSRLRDLRLQKAPVDFLEGMRMRNQQIAEKVLAEMGFSRPREMVTS
jgi:polysaccharide pyruvyl transferase WcaK-like protein